MPGSLCFGCVCVRFFWWFFWQVLLTRYKVFLFWWDHPCLHIVGRDGRWTLWDTPKPRMEWLDLRRKHLGSEPCCLCSLEPCPYLVSTSCARIVQPLRCKYRCRRGGKDTSVLSLSVLPTWCRDPLYSINDTTNNPQKRKQRQFIRYL